MNAARFVIIGNGGYGLICGEITATDNELRESGNQVRVTNCRNIRYWYGKKGGITSLAVFGPCGPKVSECRIGAPCPSALITEVKTIFDCTDEAIAAFAAIKGY